MNMAMTVISSVPATSGTMPKAPELPTWSARKAVCGLHSSPNRNSNTPTWPKKRSVSNKSESTMPAVTKTAMVEDAISAISSTFSTVLRALSSGRTRPRA